MDFTREEILETMNRTAIIPVFHHAELEIAKHVIEACYKGGVRVFEFTNRGENAYSVFVELVKYAKRFKYLILGIGTIMDVPTTDKFIKAGAKFIVSPIFKKEMAAAVRDKLWIPGCGTLTEIVLAKESGAQVIKIFPGSVLGPEFVSAVLPVVPDLKLMPTGGIELTKESLKAWFSAGVFCVGIGSKLISKEIINGKHWRQLEKKVARAISTIEKIR
jgi:2-dehydro-3-deoxyphosphogluconate aldolase / (4S)-4-hydroxy-2-oxoglutarate aldolase